MSKILIPTTPVAGGLLTVRFEGPFAAPAPLLVLRFEGDALVARSYSEDFTLPNQPPVAYVEATIAAPAAGDYVLIDERCEGLPPPPQPLCTQTVLQGFTIAEVAAVPTLDLAGITCLLAALSWIALAQWRQGKRGVFSAKYS